MLASIRAAVILVRFVMRSPASEIALSTMWSQRYNQMDRFVQDVQEFGFTHVELNSILTPEKLNELLKLGIRVSSIHCPCPVTTSHLGIPAASLQLSSLDETERKEALRFAQTTIELAFEVGAIGVHLHDVRGICDHCTPGVGTVDWHFTARNLPPSKINVCEVGEWNARGSEPALSPS